MSGGEPLSRTAGGSIVEVPVTTSFDGKHVFVACRDTVRVLSVSTGECLCLLRGHGGRVTRTTLHPLNRLQLVTSSLDGSIRVWDYSDGVCLQTFSGTLPVEDVFASSAHPGILYWTTSTQKAGKSQAYSRVYAIDLEKRQRKEAGLEGSRQVLKTRRCSTWTLDARGTLLVGYDRRTLVVFNMREGALRKYEWSHAITAVACHPTEPSIAVGDSLGKISLWLDMDQQLEKPVQTSFHWHAHGVSSLQFNSDGAYLMSGGEEGVLVVWQVETRQNRFLPRLGAPLANIAVNRDDTMYAVSTLANQVVLVDAISFRNVQVFKGLAAATAVDLQGPPMVTASPKGDNIVIAAGVGTLQVYNPARDRAEYDLEVFHRNYISRTQGKAVTPVRVQHVAFCKGGEYMATVESRDDNIFPLDTRLKIWAAGGSTSQRFVETTCVEPPHRGEVTSLCADVTDTVFVTAGSDGVFKIWARGQLEPHAWQCRAVGEYHGLTPVHTALSVDGSLLAVTTANVVTLWDPASCDLRQALRHPSKQPLETAAFVAEAPYLLTHSANTVHVWSLLTCGMCWSLQLPVNGLAVDPFSSNFAVVVEEGSNAGSVVVVFNPAAVEPAAIHVLPAEVKANAVLYLKPEQGHSEGVLAVLDSDLALWTTDAESQPVLADESKQAVSYGRGISRIFGSSDPASPSRAAFSNLAPAPASGPSDTPSAVVFGSASHVAPAVDRVARQFLTMLLPALGNTDGEAAGAKAVAVESESSASEAEGETESEDDGPSPPPEDHPIAPRVEQDSIAAASAATSPLAAGHYAYLETFYRTGAPVVPPRLATASHDKGKKQKKKKQKKKMKKQEAVKSQDKGEAGAVQEGVEGGEANGKRSVKKSRKKDEVVAMNGKGAGKARNSKAAPADSTPAKAANGKVKARASPKTPKKSGGKGSPKTPRAAPTTNGGAPESARRRKRTKAGLTQ